MVLPNYDFVRGSMRVNPDGTLQLGVGMVLVHQDGTMAPATITGSASGNTITGTINGSIPFNLALTTIQDQPFNHPANGRQLHQHVTSTGTWVVISIVPAGPADPCQGGGLCGGSIQGYAYASQADALAGNIAKAIGDYQGTISPTDVPAGCRTCIATPTHSESDSAMRPPTASRSIHLWLRLFHCERSRRPDRERCQWRPVHGSVLEAVGPATALDAGGVICKGAPL